MQRTACHANSIKRRRAHSMCSGSACRVVRIPRTAVCIVQDVLGSDDYLSAVLCLQRVMCTLYNLCHRMCNVSDEFQ